MRLTGLELRGFRRFVSADLDLSEPLVALTGPNEAGKSSILRAIHLLDDDEVVDPRDVTRGTPAPHDRALVRGLFRLDGGDRHAIEHLPGAVDVQHFVLERFVDGSFVTEARPAPIRPTGTVDEALRTLARARARATRFRRTMATTALLDTLQTVETRLESFRNTGWNDDGDDDALVVLRLELGSAIANEELPDRVRELTEPVVTALISADEARKEEHPNAAMLRLLYQRRPRFIPFMPAERELRGAYDLSVDAASPPAALANIAALAGLRLADVLDSRNAGDYGRVDGLLEEANDQLKVAMRTWSQSSLTLRLRADENVLRLLVTTPDRSWLTDITERSDGLRSYIALLAAIAWARRTTESKRPTVLLLDEAEQHLHYDAQADLVEVLTSGQLANQVVYTTHSAGCLPEDLGAAVRVILPHLDTERSSIRNWFWEAGPGFSPLLLGMGASSLAFTSARRAVLTEGASDTIALPSLLREALGVPRLGYQVAPGLAQVSKDAARDLDLEAARAIYLVDGDPAGRGITRKLQLAGVCSDDLVTLGGASSGMTLEDLLTPTAFKSAAAAALRRSDNSIALRLIPAPKKGRAAALQAACMEAGVSPPSKRVLAQEIVILARAAPVLSTRGAKVLCQLHARIADRLGLPADAVPNRRSANVSLF